jgi:transporter family-2 protein
MPVILLAILAGLVAGAAIGVQNPLASIMGQRVGLLQSAFIIHVGGAAMAGVLLLLVPGGQLAAWRTVPWYALAAGGLGVILITSVSFTIPRIGIAATVGLLVAAQLTVGAWLDHHGYLEVTVRTFDAWRALGLVLLLAGTWLVLR